MVRFLIVTQGELGDVLLRASRTIGGSCRCLQTLSLDWEDSIEHAAAKVGAALESMRGAEGVVILTDMAGSTPYNVCSSFCEPGRVELVAGVNLPMVLRVGCQDEHPGSAGEVAAWLEGKGRRSVHRHEPEAEAAS